VTIVTPTVSTVNTVLKASGCRRNRVEKPMSVSIRQASERDEADLIALAWRLTAFTLPAWRKPEHIAEADAREMMEAIRHRSPVSEVFVAERDGVTAGCLHMVEVIDFFGLKHGHISVIAVTPEAEGSGVGRALMEHAEAWTSRRGHSLLTLNVFAANARARRFYERAGYAPEILKYSKALKIR
jgi:GNAT superfamily N-acetyltransferase